jgi:Tfp pilus assembly protein PilF
MNNIGLVYTNNNQFGNALEYFEKCLKIQNDIKGKDSIDVATTLNNIGFVHWKQGDLQKAL